MAHFWRVLRANRLKKKWARLVEEKEIGLLGEGEDESDDSSQSRSTTLKKKFQRSWLWKFTIPNTTENIIWNSFIGFVGGVLLTYIFFFFFNIGVNFSLRTTTYICGLMGIFLCLGLAYSSRVRCYVLLLLPAFFSKQGRQALLAYALFLAFTGPAKNTMHNIGILSDSMTCGQEMISRTLRQIFEMVKAPFKSIKETLKKFTQAIKEAVEAVKVFVNNIKRIISSILNVIKKAASWLGSIVNFCNKKIGTPFQRCMKTFDDAIIDCKAKLGVMDFLCHVVHVVKSLCYTVKWLDFICLFTDFISDKIIAVVKRKLREFGLHMKALFYVSIEFSHTYEFETKASNSTRQVAKTILRKIAKKMEKVQSLFSFFGFMFGFVFIFMFFKAYYYKYKFLTSDHYDNYYINKYIIELDLKRAKMNRETVLPLEPREKKKYAKVTTIRLLRAERTRIAESMFLLSLTTMKIITFILVDYSLFWVLITIYEAGQGTIDEKLLNNRVKRLSRSSTCLHAFERNIRRGEVDSHEPNKNQEGNQKNHFSKTRSVKDRFENSKFGVHVKGKGILANFYKNLGNTLQVPKNPDMHLNPLHCLPDPVQPDTGRYTQIGFLVGLCWFLTVTEAYGLRLRNVVMSHYYPDRAKERAVWLYNHILRSRGSFVKFARRQLRRKFGSAGQPIEKVSLKQRLFASFPLLRAIFGKNKESNCLICGAPESESVPLKRCKKPGCPGRFCLKCYASIENICTICQSPIEYGDMSDISEEVDSSEEDMYKKLRNREKSNSPERETSETSVIFKDLQTRDSFRDLEANKKPDYVRLGDLYNDKTALKESLKEALQKRLQNLEAARHQSLKQKETKYKQTKSKIQEMIQKLRREKVQQIYKSKSSTGEESVTLLPKSKEDHKKLRNEVKEKINTLKRKLSRNRHSLRKPVRFNEEMSEREGESNKKSANALTYYFVEKETDFFKPEFPKLEACSELSSEEPQMYVKHWSFKSSRHDNFII